MLRKSIKKNTIYSILKTGSSIVFPLITFPYITRTLLTENVGKINFGLSIVSYFSFIASLGITTYAIRECASVSGDEEKLGNTASQIFSINIITTIVAYAALAVTLFFYRRLDDYRTLIAIQSLSIVAATLGADWLNSAMEDFRYITIRTIMFQLMSLVLVFIFVHKPEDYIKYALISLISSAGASVTNICYRKKYCRLAFTLNMEWKRHMFPIINLFVMILAQTIFNSVDSTMLGLVHGDYEVGIYSAAHKILNVINQVVASLLFVIMPRASYFYTKGEYKELNRLLKKVLQFNFTLGLPCVVGATILAKDIIEVAAGYAFVDAAPVLQILMIGFLFSLIGGNFLGNAILLPSKQEKYYMIVCCVAALVNIILNFFTIPYFGAKAAAGTTTICSFIIMVLLFFKVDKHIHMGNILKLIAAPIIGCTLIVAVCVLCRTFDNLYFRTIASVVFSSIAYFIFQIVLKNDLVLELLRSLQKKL